MREFFHKNNITVSVNKEPARSYFIPFGSLEQISTDIRDKSDRFLNLSGQWSYKEYDCPEDIPDSVLAPDYVISPLKKADVPSFLHNQGNNELCFSEDLPFPYDPPYVPDFNPTVVFFRDFDAGKIADFQQKYLVFDGIAGQYYIYINGQFAGFGNSDRSTCEFNISSLLQDGINRIAIVVCALGAGSYLNFIKGQNFFGLIREIYLLGRPNAHIKDFSLSTYVDPGYREAKVEIKIESICPETATVSLFGADGRKLETKNSDSTGEIDFTVNYPVMWSAETPDLYAVVIEACGEFICHRFGLRHITFDDGNFHINGRKVLLKGVGLNELDAKKGCSISLSQMQNTIAELKKNNINAVKSNGYPYDPRFLQLCDRCGLYVIDEPQLNITGDGLSSAGYDALAEYYIDSAVKRDRNCTAVVMWSLAGKYKSDNLDLFEVIRGLDNTRPIIATYDKGGDFGNYKAFDRPTPEECLKGVQTPDEKSLIIVSCSETNGNSAGSFADFFRCSESPRFIGMFAGQWTNPAIETKSTAPAKMQDGFKDANGLEHTALSELKQVYRPFNITPLNLETGDFAVTNLYDFIYLSRLECVYEITRYGKLVGGGTVGIMPVAPQKTEKIHLDYDIPDGDVYIRFIFRMLGECSYAPPGAVAGFQQFHLSNKPAEIPAENSGELLFEENAKTIVIAGENFKYTFSKFTAGFLQMESDGKTLFNAPSEFNIWRVPNGNDEKTVKLWKKYGLDRKKIKVYNVSCQPTAGCVIINCNFSIASDGENPFINCEAIYSVDSTGTVSLKCITSVDENIPYLPRFGLKFYLSKDLKAEYYGLGPDANYSDRCSSAYMGHFEADVARLSEEFSVFQESSNRHVQLAGIYDKARFGLLIFEKNGFDFSAEQNVNLSLNSAVITADYMQSGLGFGRNYPPCQCARLENKNFVYSIKFRPVTQKDSSLLSYLINDSTDNRQ